MIVITASSYAQPPAIQWQKTYGGSSSDVNTCMAKASDGGYVLAGYIWSADGDASVNHGESDFWIIKIDAAGILQWQKSAGGSSQDQATCIIQTKDGGYLVAGESLSSDGDLTQNNRGMYDMWVVKLSNTGNIEWQRSLGGPGNESARSVVQTQDNGYIIAGFTSSTSGDVSNYHGGNSDAWLVKLTANGTLQWQKTLGGTGDESIYNIKNTIDNQLILAGYTSSTDGDVSSTNGFIDQWVIKADTAGNIQWQNTFGGTDEDVAYDVKQTSDGGYIVAGNSLSTNGDINNAHGGFDYSVIKLSTDGALQWQNSFGGSNTDAAKSIEQTADGGYIVAGVTTSNDGDISGYQAGLSDWWLVKISTSGALQWQKTLGGTGTFSPDEDGEEANAIFLTPDQGYIIAGWTNSNDGDVTGNHGTLDYWVVKMGPDAVVPVSLVSFTGRIADKKILINWQTAEEINTAFFIVEKSKDGRIFSALKQVAASGTSSSLKNYSFTDDTPFQPVTWYRLKQVDKDGKFVYSKMVAVKYSTAAFTSLNAALKNNTLNIHFNNDQPGDMLVQLTDNTGRVIVKKKITVSPGATALSIPVRYLSRGIYYLSVRGKEAMATSVLLNQ